MTETRVEIEQDGTMLHGGEWVTPQRLIDLDIEAGNLPSLKGVTPIDWPTLEPTE
ncbi:MAG: hypothetical protein GXX96_27915 [Planctomycetaceae bacterium]|nr:hypothetical protein [Planctomycetaceae bacterium]